MNVLIAITIILFCIGLSFVIYTWTTRYDKMSKKEMQERILLLEYELGCLDYHFKTKGKPKPPSLRNHIGQSEINGRGLDLDEAKRKYRT